MIVETSSNQLFQVRPAGGGIDHAWLGIEVKRVGPRDAYEFTPKKNARETLVRKAGCRVVSASYDTVEDFGDALRSLTSAGVKI